MEDETMSGTAHTETPPPAPAVAPPGLGVPEVTIWGSERPTEAALPPPPAPHHPSTEQPPDSPWWPVSATPPPLAPPEPSHRGRLVVIALAVLLVAGGGVAGVILATSGSQHGAVLPSSPTGLPSVTGPLIPGAPASFAAAAKNGGEIDLSWAQTPVGTALSGFNLYRDGALLTQIAPSLTTYRDVAVVPETTYTYALEAVSNAGRSVQTTQVVSTPKAPTLASARVNGGFSIKGTFTKENFTNRTEGGKYTSFWIFTPSCGGDKACDVKTSGEGEGSSKVLKLTNGTYSGVVAIPGGGECGSKKLTETQTITFTVTEAAFTDGVWQATKVSGTSRFNVPASLGCLAGFGWIAFTGTLSA